MCMTNDFADYQQPRLSINLTPKAIDALKAVTARQQESKTEAVIRAIHIYDKLSQRLEAGQEFMIRKPDGTVEAVLFL